MLTVHQEVGYRLGLGDIQSSSDTKLEFMTHGLFVHLAQDVSKLLQRYCVVMIDEAHERSIEIDLSFALLRRALQVASKDHISFKVIVSSATIDSQTKVFAAFLQPTNQHIKILKVPGSSFPVHVQHMDLVDLDAEQIGSCGVGKVLTAHAIQTAMEILLHTAEGNILVFMPGEAQIKRALREAWATIKLKLNFGEQSAEDDPAPEGFIFDLKKSKIGVFPFYAKLTKYQRDRVLNPKEDRVIVFTTNVAETGLTIPNVRYIIDTGLEKQVNWNHDTLINEMETSEITKSSMQQRTGRAGRVASGICIRLYSKEASQKVS